MQLDLGPVLGGLNVSPFFGNKYMISGVHENKHMVWVSLRVLGFGGEPKSRLRKLVQDLARRCE